MTDVTWEWELYNLFTNSLVEIRRAVKLFYEISHSWLNWFNSPNLYTLYAFYGICVIQCSFSISRRDASQTSGVSQLTMDKYSSRMTLYIGSIHVYSFVFMPTGIVFSVMFRGGFHKSVTSLTYICHTWYNQHCSAEEESINSNPLVVHMVYGQFLCAVIIKTTFIFIFYCARLIWLLRLTKCQGEPLIFSFTLLRSCT